MPESDSDPKKNTQAKPSDPKRDFNDEVIKEDFWLKLTRIFHKLIGKT